LPSNSIGFSPTPITDTHLYVIFREEESFSFQPHHQGEAGN
jgi:hypothetical protein